MRLERNAFDILDKVFLSKKTGFELNDGCDLLLDWERGDAGKNRSVVFFYSAVRFTIAIVFDSLGVFFFFFYCHCYQCRCAVSQRTVNSKRQKVPRQGCFLDYHYFTHKNLTTSSALVTHLG